MKRYFAAIVIFILAVLPVVAQSAETEPQRFYMVVRGVQSFGARGDKTIVTLQPGQLVLQALGVSESDLNRRCHELPMTTMADTLNYMSAYGWRLASTGHYGGGTTVYHEWIIYKDVTDPGELADFLGKKKQ